MSQSSTYKLGIRAKCAVLWVTRVMSWTGAIAAINRSASSINCPRAQLGIELSGLIEDGLIDHDNTQNPP
jgi:hypothetical protein